MAETLVLANLQVNADGTISAYSRTGQAVTLLERQTRQSVGTMERNAKGAFDQIGLSSKRLLDGFFNIRQAIRGLFLGFSVGTAVLAIGNLIQETITATDWFKQAKAAVVDWFHAFVLNEDAATAAIRHISALTKELGIRDSAAIQAQIDKMKELIALKEQQIRGIPIDIRRGGTIPDVKTGIGGSPAVPGFDAAIQLTADQAVLAAKDVAQYRIELAKLEAELAKLGTTAPKVAAAFKASDFPWQGPSLDMLKDLPPTIFDQIIAWNQLQQAVDAMGDPFQQIIQSQVEVLDVLNNTTSSLDEQLDALDLLQQKYALYAQVVSAAQSAVAAAAEAGIISSRRAAQAQAILLAAEFTLRGLGELAAAVAALATPGMQWAAPLHKAAAGLYFAAAAFVGASAFRGGGGGASVSGGTGSNRGGFRENEVPSEAFRESGIGQQISITVEGPIIGSDPNAIARWIQEILIKARRDGMRST